ncbi:MAG: hypothetical protein C5B50_05400 [Verrucomicrobia bacterium]|nr:MAG: hypothetical protein C5B50_05400 [Verrucomicrobiota bacterium]
MNEKPEFIGLEPDNLISTNGYLSYTEYRKEFSGRYDSSGDPLFEWGQIRPMTPIAPPTVGQYFEGLWVLAKEDRFVVIDTPWLRLALPINTSLRQDLPDVQSFKPTGLLAEAVAVADEKLGLSTAWRIYEQQDDETLRCLTPQLVAVCAEDCEGCETVRQLPLDKALDSLTHEINHLNAQRRAANPNSEPELPAERAIEVARFEILGAAFREALMGRAGVLGMVKALGGNAYRHCYVAPSGAPGERPSGPKEWNETLERMQRAVKHPLIYEAIAEKAQWLMEKDHNLAYRLKQLGQQRAGIAEKLSLGNQSMETAVHVPTQKPSETSSILGENVPSPWSPIIKKGQLKAPRFKI